MSIRSALESHLAAWVADQSPIPPVAWENVTFTPPAVSITYLRAFRMPANRYGKTLCSIEEAGVYQVSILYAKPGGAIPAGTAGPESMAESICEHFAAGSYTGFQVLRPPYYAAGLPTDDGRWHVPVSIFYIAEP